MFLKLLYGKEIQQELETGLALGGWTITIVSPYITKIQLDKNLFASSVDYLEFNSLEEDARYIIITDMNNVMKLKKMDLFLRELSKKICLSNLYIFHLSDLHTKLYLFHGVALLGSFNFTHKGVQINYELGMKIEEEQIIKELRKYVGFLLKATTPINEKAKALFEKLKIGKMDTSRAYDIITNYLNKMGYDPKTHTRGDGYEL